MPRAFLLVSLLLIAAGASAQDATQRVPMAPLDSLPSSEDPDFSRDTLLRLFADADLEREEVDPRFRHSIGAVDFKAMGMRWRIGYLPFFAPFQGSYLTTNREWPDPFTLTGTAYASPPRTWRRGREMSAELKRIERRLRKDSSVVVRTD
jgi:hypothetical protein